MIQDRSSQEPMIFTNPYVNFAENLAEWYSYVGCYGKGVLSKTKYQKGYGYIFDNQIYINSKLFSELVSLLYNDFNGASTNSKYQLCATSFITIIDKYDVTTFNDFYSALIKEFPSKNVMIQTIFETPSIYTVYGDKMGNVINY